MSYVRNIVLSKRSREALSGKNTEGHVFWSVSDQIEFGDWYVPGEETEYSKLRANLARSFRDFFSLSEDDPVEIKRFDSDILSFNDGIYPDYTTEDGDPDKEWLSDEDAHDQD